MRRRSFLAGGAALLACARPAPRTPPEAVVERIYEPYTRGLGGRRRLETAAPWTDEMRDLIVRAFERSRELEQPFIDFDPFFGAQEIVLGDLAIAVESPPADGRAVMCATILWRSAAFGASTTPAAKTGICARSALKRSRRLRGRKSSRTCSRLWAPMRARSHAMRLPNA
jgi:hypothetical protein